MLSSNARPTLWPIPALVAICLVAACSSESRDADGDRDADTSDTIDAGSADAGHVDGGGEATDGGTHQDPPDPAYWGFADRNCFRYDDGSKQNAFTLAIMKDVTAVASITTFRLVFRQNGFSQREEWLEVKGDGLALWRRTRAGDPFAMPPTPPSYSIFQSPAPVYLAREMPAQVPVISKTTAKVTEGSTNEQVATTVTVIKDSDETIDAIGEQHSASKLLLSVTRDDDGSGTLDRLWFAPNAGLMKYQLDGMNAPVTLMKLEQNVAPASCTP